MHEPGTTTHARIPFEGRILAGTLHHPAGDAPYPAIIMLQGSGPDDRDSGGFFTPVRDWLIAAGFAVLSWDKQGVGGSTGDWRHQTIANRAEEARAALAWLRGQPAIDPGRIGLWGHSQGGWVAPLVAAQEPGVALLVIHSGTGLTPFAQDHVGMERTLRRDGGAEEDVARGHAFLHELHVAAELAMPYDEMRDRLIVPAYGKPWLGYFGEVDPDLWQFFVLNAGEPLDPLWALRRVTCPTLAVFGERDVLIPVERSIEILRETVGVRGVELAIHVFPDADHRLHLEDGSAFPPGYVDTMIGWMREQIDGACA